MKLNKEDLMECFYDVEMEEEDVIKFVDIAFEVNFDEKSFKAQCIEEGFNKAITSMAYMIIEGFLGIEKEIKRSTRTDKIKGR